MDPRRRHLVLGAGSAWLAGCGGGGGEPPAPPPPPAGGTPPVAPLAAPAFATPPATLQALHPVTLQVQQPDPASSYRLQADLGQGHVVDIAGDPQAGYPFTPPVGRLDAQRQWSSGTLRLTLTRTRGGASAHTSVDLPLALAAAGTPGSATATLLRATQLMAQQSLSQMGLLTSKLPAGADLSSVAAQANQLNARYAELEALLRGAMAGQPAMLELGGGVQLELTPALRAQLDAHALAFVALLPPSAAASAHRRHALAGDEFEDEARSLAQQMAEAARRVSGAVGSTVGLAAGLVAVGAGLAGATPLALAAGGIAATAWMVSTLYGTAVGATLDGGSAALLDGQATWQDFAPTGKFFADQYLSLAKDQLISIGAKLPLGGKLEDLITIASSAADTYQSLTDLQLLPAFEAGTLDKGGYPDSDFTLDVQASTEPSYIVQVVAYGGGEGARVRLQISGTDGYVFNQDTSLDGGQASFHPQPAAPGSGIVDTINVFDLDGRASASTTVQF